MSDGRRTVDRRKPFFLRIFVLNKVRVTLVLQNVSLKYITN